MGMSRCPRSEMNEMRVWDVRMTTVSCQCNRKPFQQIQSSLRAKFKQSRSAKMNDFAGHQFSFISVFAFPAGKIEPFTRSKKMKKSCFVILYHNLKCIEYIFLN